MAESADPTGFISDEELKVTQESKRRRREALVDAIKRAGINPAEIDVTMIVSNEEQAKLVQQMADRKEAKEMAERFGRQALRDRLKKSAETCRWDGTYKPSKNGTKPRAEDDAPKG
jgi:wyosine [tRNA(Phe)-imidazoG37] synthetase (radical SAM superfamily)